MSLSDCHRAILKGVVDVLGAIPTAHENVKFTPPDRALWASVFFMPNEPSVSTLGDVGEDAVDGIVQVDLNYPALTGDAESRAMSETFRQAFKAGKRFIHDGQEVVVMNCAKSRGRSVDSWFRVSMTIGWYASIPR